MSLGLLTGCAVNKGTALADAFSKDWAGTPDVTEIRSNGHNTLPFSGTATGELIVADGTPADRVTRLASELQAYVAEHDKVTGRITAGGITVTVVAEATRNAEALALWRSLAEDDRVRDGDLAEATTGEVIRRRIRVTAVDPAAAMAVFQDMVTGRGLHAPLPHVRSLAVRTEPKARPSLHVETDHDGAVPEQAIAAYEAVRAEFDLVSATIRPDRTIGSTLSVVVAPDVDPAAAAEVALAAAPALSSAIKVTHR
jgi:hypothetical protein